VPLTSAALSNKAAVRYEKMRGVFPVDMRMSSSEAGLRAHSDRAPLLTSRADVAVHAGIETFMGIARQGISRHGQNWHGFFVGTAERAYSLSRLKPVYNRHPDVHRDRVVIRHGRTGKMPYSDLTVLRGVNENSFVFEERSGYFLIEGDGLHRAGHAFR
jgi:hypothetical protein